MWTPSFPCLCVSFFYDGLNWFCFHVISVQCSVCQRGENSNKRGQTTEATMNLMKVAKRCLHVWRECQSDGSSNKRQPSRVVARSARASSALWAATHLRAGEIVGPQKLKDGMPADLADSLKRAKRRTATPTMRHSSQRRRTRRLPRRRRRSRRTSRRATSRPGWALFQVTRRPPSGRSARRAQPRNSSPSTTP